jgi:hypothetical protein
MMVLVKARAVVTATVAVAVDGEEGRVGGRDGRGRWG